MLYNYKFENYAKVIIFAFILFSANKEFINPLLLLCFCFCFSNMTGFFLYYSMMVYISEELEVLNID